MLRNATALVLVALLVSCYGRDDYEPHAGDIVFQDLPSSQSEAIKLATGSKFTHCGIVFDQGGHWMVYEAVGPVRITPLNEWIDQGEEGKYVAKRLTPLGKYLTPAVLKRMQAIADEHLGKPYDPFFEWSNERMYCSELVWKIYYEGFGLELAPLRRLGSYDLGSPVVKEKLEDRFGKTIPRNEPVVAPSDLLDSDQLFTVF